VITAAVVLERSLDTRKSSLGFVLWSRTPCAFIHDGIVQGTLWPLDKRAVKHQQIIKQIKVCLVWCKLCLFFLIKSWN